MMKKFLIRVNGKQYEVEVEEIKNTTSQPQPSNPQPQVQTAPQAAPKVEEKAPQAAEPKKVVAQEGQEVVKAPMPGTILNINVKEGDNVKKGQILLILEAMKMENEIVAPEDGTVASINVSAGQSVEAGDLLATLN